MRRLDALNIVKNSWGQHILFDYYVAMKRVSASLLVAVCLQLCQIVVTAWLLPLNISSPLLSLLEPNSNINIALRSSISNLTHPN